MTKTFSWHGLIGEISKKIPAEKFRAWIEPLEFVELNETDLVLSASYDLAKDLVPQLFRGIFHDVLHEEYGLHRELKVERSNFERAASDSSAMLAVAGPAQKHAEPAPPAAEPLALPAEESFGAALDEEDKSLLETGDRPEAPSIVSARALPATEGYSALSVRDPAAPAVRTLAQPLNPKHTFDTYVVGASNQFAHAAARAVAENPARQYNPLFVYSNAGLGKTHLLHAIGNHILKLNPRARICYLSAEKFVNDLIEAIQHGKQSQFRQKYREGYDVLLMDDIQFIANKTTSQEEFFHTFDALHSSDKQIVVASDKFPKDIPGLEERIRSRFEWGLVVDVQIPDIETRIAILRAKAEQDDIFLPNDVALFLASNVKSNIRELEGALLRMGAKASLLGEEISLDLARQELKNLIKQPADTIGADAILDAVSKHFSVKISEIKGKDRSRKISVPRQIAMFLLRKYCRKSYPDIGALLGGKDHSTILHGVRMITENLAAETEIKQHVEQIQSSL
ncbi:MAG: chromosomal replication initiator protein DnaA [Deltaproteobacteria bacterium]|nr:chromosomal replication initiator protein DnaA [Deltaproteobacteria bacterium]